MKRSWWSPSSITFTKAQVLWLLSHLSLIRLGFWPPEHRESGYTGGKGKGHGHSAPYELAVQVAAELDQRIEHCGQDGLLLEMAYSQQEDYFLMVQHIANALRIDLGTVERRINNALRYVCGKSRKSRSYDDFKRHK